MMTNHTRRDAFKMAAAAAAGSVAERVAKMDGLIPTGHVNTEDHDERISDSTRARGERILAMNRLQQAIELGDRAAEELGCEDWRMWRVRLLVQPEQRVVVRWEVVFYLPWPSFDYRGEDPDPLTAVEKARAAALKWKAEQ